MKTDDLIQRLGADARPVRPLAPAWQRAAAWLAGAVGYVLLVGVGSWLRHGTLLGVSDDPAYLIQQLALFASAIVAADAAFASVIPGEPRRPLWMLIAPAAVLTGALLWGVRDDLQTHGTIGAGREVDWPCVASIVAGTAILWSAALLLLHRGAALSPGVTGLLAGVAAVSLANIEACVTRAHDFSVTVLVWHGLTSLAILAASAAIGRRAMRWPARGADLARSARRG